MDDEEDPVVAILPVHFTTSLAPNLHLHQFPLLNRPLQVPPSAVESGKKIRARYKPRAVRLEVRVPVDVRKEVWNPDKGLEFGRARAEEESEQKMADMKKIKEVETEHRLNDVTLRSENIVQKGDYMLGIVRDGMHLGFSFLSLYRLFILPSFVYQDISIYILFHKPINFVLPLHILMSFPNSQSFQGLSEVMNRSLMKDHLQIQPNL